MQQQLEQETAKQQQSQVIKQVAIVTARVKAYDSFERFQNHNGEIDNKTN